MARRKTNRAIRMALQGTIGVALLGYSGDLAPLAAQSQSPPNRSATSDAELPTVRVTATRSRPPARTARPVVRAQRTSPSLDAPPPASNTTAERANGPVTGYLAHQSGTGTKTDTPLLETPQSISIVTRDQIQAQGAQSVMDALRYTPSLSIEGKSVGQFYDEVKIRGFDAPRYLDGLRLPADISGFGVPRIETYGLERIEVLKGPSSGLYGQSEPGGLLNMVSRRPQARPHAEVVGTFGSYERLQGAFDVGGPLDKNGEFLYRIVGLARQSDAQFDFTQDNKLFIAPSFTWRPTMDTSLTILSHYQKIENRGYQQYVPGQVTFLANPFGRMPANRYLGEPTTDRYTMEQAAIGYAFEHRFDNNLQFRQNLRYMEASMNMFAMRGDYMRDPITFQPSDRYFLRTPIGVAAQSNSLAIDNQLQADFRTGALEHKMLVGFDYLALRSSNDSRLAGSLAQYSPIDVFNPVYGAFPIPPVGALTRFINASSRQEQFGLYAQDQIKLDRWTLSITGRQDWSSYEVESKALVPSPGRYQRRDTATTGRVGLNYLFDSGVSPYANFSTSFVPNSGVTAEGSSLKPTTGRGAEIGVKYIPNGMNLMLTAALFDIVQNDVVTANPLNPFVSTQTDKAQVRGVEFEARGNVTREFEIIAGYSRLDPKVTESIAGNTGKYLPNTNLEQASLWGKYSWFDGPLAGFGIGAGVRYLGDNYGDAANTIRIPSFTLFDASFSYDLAYARHDLKGWKAQVNISNIANTYYVTSCATALEYCGLGANRTVLGTLKYAWN